MKFKRTGVAVLAGLAIFATGCSTVSTAPDMVALHYKGGSFSSQTFENCVPVSKRERNGPGDHYFRYPASQRNYDATGGEGSDAAPFIVVSKDNAEMAVPVIINFDLDTNCDTLRKFHETIGNRDAAFWNSDVSSEIPQGWRNSLSKIVGKPADTVLDREAKQFNYRDLRNSADARVQLQQAVQHELPTLAKVAEGGNEFLINWQVTVLSPTPTNPALVDAIAAEQNNIAQANAAKAKAEADKATAEAQVAVETANARKRREEVKGYGSVEEYNKAKAIERGLNPYQPTIVAPGVTGN